MLDTIFDTLSDNEAAINAVVGLLTLGAALWGAIELTLRGRRAGSASGGVLPEPLAARVSTGRWSSILNLGLGSHSRLEHLVSVRSVNVVLFGLGCISLLWLMVSLSSTNTSLLAVMNLLVFVAVLTGFVLQWNGRTGPARWILILAANLYWTGSMLAVGPRAGTEYFLVGNMMLPVLVFSRSEFGQMLLALLFVMVVFGAGVGLSLNVPPALDVSERFVEVGYLANAVLLALIILLSVSYYRSFAASSYHELEAQQEKNDYLMSSLFPERILKRLEQNEPAVADWHSDATVLYLTVSGFSVLHNHIPALELVGRLGAVFADFDRIAQEYGLDKIKTLGTTYVAATGIGGMTSESEDVVACALEMRGSLQRFASEQGMPLSFRCGVASGIAISGVMADARPRYDLWGEALEEAARLGESAEPDTVCVDPDLAWRLAKRFTVEFRDEVGVVSRVHEYRDDDAEPAAVS